MSDTQFLRNKPKVIVSIDEDNEVIDPEYMIEEFDEDEVDFAIDQFLLDK